MDDITVEEKLGNFSKVVLNQATEKRGEILANVKEDCAALIKRKEKEILESAKQNMQKELRKLSRQQNEIISREIMDSKKILLQKREEIINKVFCAVDEKLLGFTKSSKYKDFLFNKINEGLGFVTGDDITVYINRKDSVYEAEINKLIQSRSNGGKISIEYESEDILGGCKIFDASKNIYIDNSLLTALKAEKEKFFIPISTF